MDENRTIELTPEKAELIFTNLDAICRQGIGAAATSSVTAILSILNRANQESIQKVQQKQAKKKKSEGEK